MILKRVNIAGNVRGKGRVVYNLGMDAVKEYRKLEELREWDKNPRNISNEGLGRLKTQISRLGQYKPILITPDGEVLGGNMRLKAYRELEIKDVWVSVIKPKDEKQKLEYALSDNDRAGYYDDELLANLSLEMPDFNFGDYSVDLKEPTNLSELLDSFKEVVEDETPEIEEGLEPISKLGEVYQLGRHRLMCGDSTKIEDVEKLMNGQKADMVFSDPPYGMDLDTDYSKMPGTSTKYKKVIGDDTQFDMTKVFQAIDSPIWYVWGADYLYKTIPNFDKGNMIVWAKRQSEQENAVFGSAYELCWTYPKRKKEIWFVRAINQSSERLGEHPTQKPIELTSKALKQNESAKNIVDLFGGSGSTLIACEQLNRTCYMMELDPKYTDVIRKRYWKFINGSEEGWQENTPVIYG